MPKHAALGVIHEQQRPFARPWGRLTVTLLAPGAVAILSRLGPIVVDTSALAGAQRSTWKTCRRARGAPSRAATRAW
jgi:hypothetical protein